MRPLSHNRYDEKLKEMKREKKMKHLAETQGERQRFEARMNMKLPRLRIAYAAWANALEDPPFGTGEFTWQLTITFPFRILKDEKMKRFWEVIQDAFQKIYFS